MAKIRRQPQPFVYPLPVALVTCLEPGGGPNILTVSWITPVCATPPMLAISLRPHRYSTQVIQETGEFTVNIPTHDLAYEVDLCGTLSGREVEKVRLSGLTEIPGACVGAPLLAECAAHMECRTSQVIPLGSHILFLAEIVALHLEEDLLTRVEESEGGDDAPVLELARAKPLIYAPATHDYWVMGDVALYHGRSAGKKP